MKACTSVVQLCLLVVAALLIQVNPGHADPMFTGLGDLSGGHYDSYANGISPDGSTVAGYSKASSGTEAFRWTIEEGMVGLGFLPRAPYSDAYGAASNGSTIVGTGYGEFGYEPVLWTSGGEMIGLGNDPEETGAFPRPAHGTAISADGSTVVGDYTSGTGTKIFRWTSAEGMVSLGHLPGGENRTHYANGVSGDGSTIVGDGWGYSGREAFRWTSEDGMVGLGDLPGTYIMSAAMDISTDGSTIVGVSSGPSGDEAFLWTNEAEGMVGIGDLEGGGFYSEALGVSADGSTIVGTSEILAGYTAFIWDAENGMRALDEVLTAQGLDLTGWTLEEARAVSDDGRVIVGQGINPSGQPEGWIAVVPEPSTPLLQGIALILLAVLAAPRKLFVCR